MNRILGDWRVSCDFDYRRSFITKVHIGVLNGHIISNTGDRIVCAAEGIAVNAINVRCGKRSPCFFKLLKGQSADMELVICHLYRKGRHTH